MSLPRGCSISGIFNIFAEKTILDIHKQLEYWIRTGEDDIQSSQILFANKKILHGLFFCHLAIEKIIKANLVKKTGKIPPKIHNLTFLLSSAGIELSPEEKELTGILMIYQLEGRYPEYYPSTPKLSDAKKYLKQTEKLFQCLKNKL
ncbi:MAG: HEPN domain-containing protein [Bacteroidota bacterium]